MKNDPLAYATHISLRGKLIHQLKGRVRLRYRGLAHLKTLYPQIAEAICSWSYVHKVALNGVTETILVYYRPEAVTVRQMKESIDFLLSNYSLQAYKNMRLGGKKEKQFHDVSPMAASTTILKRLLVSGATMLLGKTLLRNLADYPLLDIPFLGRLTTFPAMVSLALSWPILRSAWVDLRNEARLNADLLTVTSIVASNLLGQGFSALTIIALSDCAEFMTVYTIERTRNSIKKLLNIDEDFAWKLLENGELSHCPVGEVQVGDRVVIHTGERVVVDGVILSGQALVDQSHTTGEFLPVSKKETEQIFAGTIVKSGTVTVRAQKVGDDTVVARIVALVEHVSYAKAPMQHYADQFSNYLIPINYLAAMVVFAVTRSPEQTLKMLVIDYSCGIKLSTATAFSAAINAAVKQGILIKGGAYIEQMSNANTVIFDKTGTITEGRPQVTTMKRFAADEPEERIVALACAAEETSSHPLAEAILSYGRQMGVSIPVHGETETIVGKGTLTTIDGKQIRAGSLAFMRESGVEVPREAAKALEEAIPTYVAEERKLLGLLGTVDKPRANIRRAVNNLRGKGIDEIVLLTGDSYEQAKLAARQIGADRFQAEMLPEHKADSLLKTQGEGNCVIMVGDGINDAPALALANVGISLGSKSTDVAMETSDIIIGRNDPMLIPEVLDLSRRTMDIVRQNFSLVIGINTLGLILGAASNISVFLSAMLHNMSTIAVVGNSCRILLYGNRKGPDDEGIAD